LDDFNLKVNGGSSIALVGSSGSGKTTLFNLLQRNIDPD
jgi:subfamily B ATP-binding cassette protein MsbA